MNQTEEFPLAFIPEMDSQVLELPYVGKDLSMLIILPKEIQDETLASEGETAEIILHSAFHSVLEKKNEAPKVFFCSEALEELFLVYQRTFQ